MLFRFIRGVLLYLLLIASLFYGNADNLSDGQALFATIGIPVLLLVHRIILNWQVKRQMFGYASGQKNDGDKDPEVAEKLALHRPEVVEFSGMTIPEEIVGFREALIEEVSWKLRRSWQISALACLAYAIVPPVLALLFGNTFTDAWGSYLVLVGFYFVLVTMRRNIGLKDLRPENARYDVSVSDFHPVTIIARALRVIITARADVLLALGWGILLISMSHPSAVPPDGDAGSVIHSTAFFVGTVVVMICYLAASLWRYTIPNANPNISLLVLRVFGPAKAARFTFDRVVSYWNRFGLHFTVDDPSLARFRNRFFQVRTFYEFVVLYIMSIFYWQVGIGGLLVIAAFDWIDMARRWPVKNYEQVLQRFSKTLSKPQYLDGTYKNVEMVCHMDTWRMVVAQYVKYANVILMDLRGFSEERGGSAYEVNFLFDRFPVDNIVFLRDADTDPEPIYQMMFDSWHKLRIGSPNEAVEQPTFTVFVSDDQKGHDVQGLIDLMLLAGYTPEESDGPKNPGRVRLPSSLTDQQKYQRI